MDARLAWMCCALGLTPPSPPAPDVSVTRVVLVRHGEARSNLPSAPGTPWAELDHLTDLGHEQARHAATELAQMGATAIITSPAQRTRETADDLARAVAGVMVLVDDDLSPLHEGQDAAGRLLTWDERKERWRAGDDPSPPGGESLQELGNRAMAAVRRAAAANPGGTVVLVTHAEVVSAVLAMLDGVRPLDRYPWHVPNASLTVLEIAADGTIHVADRERVP